MRLHRYMIEISGSGYCVHDEISIFVLETGAKLEGKPRCGCSFVVAGGSSRRHSLREEYFAYTLISLG